MGQATTFIDVAQGLAAVAGIIIAALVAVMPFARRPRLSLIEDPDRVHSRVESTPSGAVPHLRLLVANGKRRRAAQGTRVLVEGYRPRGVQRLVSLAHPSLGWPSAPEADESASVTIFAGGRRPIGLGRLIRVRLDEQGQIMRPYAVDHEERQIRGFPHYPDAEDAVAWYLWLELAFGLDILDNRDKLAPLETGYTVRLMIGADDGAARTFEVDVAWDGNPNLSAEQVLESILERLVVRKV